MFSPQPYPLWAFKGAQGPELVLGWIYEDGHLTTLLENGQRLDEYNPDSSGEDCWTLTPDKADAEECVASAVRAESARRRLRAVAA